MIKPATLWALFKQCEDSQWLGTICRALGGQSVELDYGQRQLLNVIKADSGWMDERIEAQREKWRERQREKRDRDKRDNGDKSQCHACHDTSVRPSVHPSNLNKSPIYARARVCARLTRETPLDDWQRAAMEDGVILPTPDLMRYAAVERKIPVEYVGEFLVTLRDCGWEYLNRGGEVVRLNQRNFPSVLKKFYDHKDITPSKGGNSNRNNGMPIGVIHQQEGYDASKFGI